MNEILLKLNKHHFSAACVSYGGERCHKQRCKVDKGVCGDCDRGWQGPLCLQRRELD